MSPQYLRCPPCRKNDHGVEFGSAAFCSCPCHIGDGSRDWTKIIEKRARELREAGASHDGGRLFVPPERPPPRRLQDLGLTHREAKELKKRAYKEQTGEEPPDRVPECPPDQIPVYLYRETRQTATGRAIIELMERDGPHCHYCERLFLGPPRKPGYMRNPSAPTLDHKIPASLGGTRARENFVLACYECNTCRGACPYWVFKTAVRTALRDWPRDEWNRPTSSGATGRRTPVSFMAETNQLRVFDVGGRSRVVDVDVV